MFDRKKEAILMQVKAGKIISFSFFYLPLFYLMLIRDAFFHQIHGWEMGYFILILFTGIISSSFYFYMKNAMQQTSKMVNILQVKKTSWLSHEAYFMPYSILLIGMNDFIHVLLSCLILILAFYLIPIKLLFINPIMLVLGFRIYKIKNKRLKAVLLTRERKINDKNLKVKRLEKNVFLQA
ncbi:MAG: hypothetical protein ACTSYS_13920 [Promethearchaeota archaeon]